MKTLADEVARKVKAAVKKAGGPITMAEIKAAVKVTIGFEDEYHSVILRVTETVDYTPDGDPLRNVKA